QRGSRLRVTTSYTGTRTVARNPPSGLSPSVISPPGERAISRARAKPRPVLARDISRDGDAEACVALVLVARIAEPHERAEHFLAHLRWNTRPIVVDVHGEPAVIAMSRDGDVLGEARGVRHQVSETAPECRRAHGHDRMSVEHDIGLVAVALDVRLELIQKGRHVGWRRLLAEIAAREGEIGLEHAAHLVDVLLHRLDFRSAAEQRELQLEARQDGPQIVRDAGQHRGALLDRTLDAPLHLDERLRGSPYLARPARLEAGHVATFAEALRRVREPEDPPAL